MTTSKEEGYEEEVLHSNKYLWGTYETPCLPNESIDRDASEPTISHHNYTIRHLKQGRTGARKTWEASKVLLYHLLRDGGPLRDFQDNNISSSCNDYNIMELGAGAGCLAIGLATALNYEACLRQKMMGGNKDKFYPKARIMSTDNDKATIKNMRHNIARQPRDRNVTKAVRAIALDWGGDVGGAAFDGEVRNQFSNEKKNRCHSPISMVDQNEEEKQDLDPLRLLTHLIASDILYEVAALEPLSSVISAIKLRNPAIKVILMLRERSPNLISNLKSRIEEKMRRGLELRLVEQSLDFVKGHPSDLQNLHTFLVNVQHLDCNVDNNIMQFHVVEC